MNGKNIFRRLITLILAEVCVFQAALLCLPVQSEAQESTCFGQVAIGVYYAACLQPDGSVCFDGSQPENVENWGKLSKICISSDDYFYGLSPDGRLHSNHPEMQDKIQNWNAVADFAVFSDHSIDVAYAVYGELVAAVKKNGTVEYAASEDYVILETGCQLDVSQWTKITSVAVGGAHIVGLRSDGTVVATGSNQYGQCDVKKWKNIVSVCAGAYCTAGLQSDGTVVMTGDSPLAGTQYLKRMKSVLKTWKNVTQIAVRHDRIYALTADGKILGLSGEVNAPFNYGGVGTIRENWTNMVSLYSGCAALAGFRRDGTLLVYSGDERFDPVPCRLVDADWIHGTQYNRKEVTCTDCGKTYPRQRNLMEPCSHYWVAERNRDPSNGFCTGSCEYICLKCAEQISYQPVMLTELDRKADSNSGSKMQDVTYGDWVTIDGALRENAIRFWVMHKEGYNDTEWVEINLNREYETLEYRVDMEQKSKADESTISYKIYGDGKLLYTVRPDHWYRGTLDVSNVNVLRISCTNTSAKEGYGIFCGRLHRIFNRQ